MTPPSTAREAESTGAGVLSQVPVNRVGQKGLCSATRRQGAVQGTSGRTCTSVEWMAGKTTPMLAPTSTLTANIMRVRLPSPGIIKEAVAHSTKDVQSTLSPPYFAAAQPPGICRDEGARQEAESAWETRNTRPCIGLTCVAV